MDGADCQTKGTAAHKKCTKCNQLFAADGTTEIDKAPEGAVGPHSFAEKDGQHACSVENCTETHAPAFDPDTTGTKCSGHADCTIKKA